MPSLPRFASVVLLAAAGSTALLTGCTTPQVAQDTVAPANVEVRVVIADGTVHGLEFRPLDAPVSYTVAPDPARNVLCGVISESQAAAARSSFAKDSVAVLAAPRILAASGQPASIQISDDQTGTMKLDVTATAEPSGSLRVTVSYREGLSDGFAFPETSFSVRPGQSIVAIARQYGGDFDHKLARVRTLIITPAPLAVASTR